MPAASTAPFFVLKALHFTGSTILTQHDADTVARPYLGRRIGLAEIEAMRRAATEQYIARGYVTSGFTVPNQDVGNGVLTLHAVEGKIGRVDVTGTHWLNPNWVKAEIGEGLLQPFDISTLGQYQQILLRDPFIKRLNLSVQPGLAPGDAVVEPDAHPGDLRRLHRLPRQAFGGDAPQHGRVPGLHDRQPEPGHRLLDGDDSHPRGGRRGDRCSGVERDRGRLGTGRLPGHPADRAFDGLGPQHVVSGDGQAFPGIQRHAAERCDAPT